MNLEEAVAILRNSLNEEDKEQRDRIAKQLVKAIKTGNKELERRINKATENMRVKVKDSKPTENKVGMNEAIEILESLIGTILRKDAEERPRAGAISQKRFDQLLKADKAKREAYSQTVKSSGGLRNFDRDTKNKKGEEKTDSRRNILDQMQVELNREDDPKKVVAIKKSIRRHNEKMNKNEALSIVEEMLSLANSIFEVAPEAAQQAEVPPSENKIKRTVKDKDSKKDKEVVSVADELFPYEGNAKQQMNQKILAKINQMIEGTATLEDLLQLVRKGSNVKKAGIKESFDRAEAMLEELINEVSKEYRNKKAMQVKKAVENERELVNKLPNMGVPKEVVQDLETDVIRKEHKLYPRLDRIEREKIEELKNKQDS